MIYRKWIVVVIVSWTVAVSELVAGNSKCQPPRPKEANTEVRGSRPMQARQDEVFVQVDEDPALPRILVIGDSISMGYTPPLRAALKNKANVQHCPENGRSSRQILARIGKYLGEKPWDVILINCGVHDITYLNPSGRAANPDQGGRVQVPLKEYRANLEQIIARLQQSGAIVVWCSTTPVSKTAQFRSAENVDRYNDAANDVMQRHGIQIADLEAIIRKRDTPAWSSDGVHYTAKGYTELAGDLVPAIQESLDRARKQRMP